MCNLLCLLDGIVEKCGYGVASEAFEVCALAVIKNAISSPFNIESDAHVTESYTAAPSKEPKVLKDTQSKRKSTLFSSVKSGQGRSKASIHNNSFSGDSNDASYINKGLPINMLTTSSKKSVSSNTSSLVR